VTPATIIDALGLRPLEPEGGRWAQSWRDATCSAIYYLLEAPDFSSFHRLDRVEIFTYHAGAPTRMTLLHPDGRLERPVLGPDLLAGERPQVPVPAGVWQAGETLGGWTLMGTVVVPPYHDDAIGFGAGDALATEFPAHAALVRRLCRR
jgi:hypothetical protein